MVSDPPSPKFKIEPFDPGKHNRKAFSSGVRQTDNYLKLNAKKFQKGDMVRVHVAVPAGSDQVIGYYALNGGALDITALGDLSPRNVPEHGQIPISFIPAFGIDQNHQGQGCGRVILAHALSEIARVAERQGCWAAVLDVFDDENIERRKRFYEERGFRSLPSQPLRMFLPVKDIRASLQWGT